MLTETEMKAKLERVEADAHLWRLESYESAHTIVAQRQRIARLEAELELVRAQLRLAVLPGAGR